MVTGGGGRGWLFLKRNDHYAEAHLPFAGGAPSLLDAPFPLRRQTEADLEAARWGLLAWEDPFAAPGPCSPFWSVAPMMEVVPAPAPAVGPGLVEIARESGASLEGLRLADGTLILKVERAERARQLRFADGAGFDPHRGSFDYPRSCTQSLASSSIAAAVSVQGPPIPFQNTKPPTRTTQDRTPPYRIPGHPVVTVSLQRPISRPGQQISQVPLGVPSFRHVPRYIRTERDRETQSGEDIARQDYQN